MKKHTILFALAMVLTLDLGAGSAQAFVAGPLALDSARNLATPVAMCVRTCRNGGRYMQGPPEVCYQNGLEYCGSSRDRGASPGAGIGIPGTGIGIGVGPGGAGVYATPSGNCRTVTIERDDGSVRRVRRCD